MEAKSECSVHRFLAQRSFALEYDDWHTRSFETSRIKDLIEEPSKHRSRQGYISTFVKHRRFKNPSSATKSIQNGIRLLILEDKPCLPGSSVVVCLSYSRFRAVHHEELICLAQSILETESICDLVLKTSRLLVQLQLVDGRTIPRSSSDNYKPTEETIQQSLKRRVEFSGSESNDKRRRHDSGSREALNESPILSHSLTGVGCRQDLYEKLEKSASVSAHMGNNIVDSRTAEEIVNPPTQVYEDRVTNNLKAHISMPEELSWGMTTGKDPASDVAKYWNAALCIDLGNAGIVSGPNANCLWAVAPEIFIGPSGMELSGPGMYSTPSAPYYSFLNAAT